jgi:hypothetical protein
MKQKTGPSTKRSEPDKVGAFMAKLQHPLANVVEALRRIILNSDPEIGEEIKWNAPAFFYTGEMPAFDAKQYKRHIAVFNLFKKDCVRLVFPTGAKIDDSDGLLEGDYADGPQVSNCFAAWMMCWQRRQRYSEPSRSGFCF